MGCTFSAAENGRLRQQLADRDAQLAQLNAESSVTFEQLGQPLLGIMDRGLGQPFQTRRSVDLAVFVNLLLADSWLRAAAGLEEPPSSAVAAGIVAVLDADSNGILTAGGLRRRQIEMLGGGDAEQHRPEEGDGPVLPFTAFFTAVVALARAEFARLQEAARVEGARLAELARVEEEARVKELQAQAVAARLERRSRGAFRFDSTLLSGGFDSAAAGSGHHEQQIYGETKAVDGWVPLDGASLIFSTQGFGDMDDVDGLRRSFNQACADKRGTMVLVSIKGTAEKHGWPSDVDALLGAYAPGGLKKTDPYAAEPGEGDGAGAGGPGGPGCDVSGGPFLSVIRSPSGAPPERLNLKQPPRETPAAASPSQQGPPAIDYVRRAGFSFHGLTCWDDSAKNSSYCDLWEGRAFEAVSEAHPSFSFSDGNPKWGSDVRRGSHVGTGASFDVVGMEVWQIDWDHYSLPGQLAEQVQHSHDDEEPIERLDIAI